MRKYRPFAKGWANWSNRPFAVLPDQPRYGRKAPESGRRRYGRGAPEPAFSWRRYAISIRVPMAELPQDK